MRTVEDHLTRVLALVTALDTVDLALPAALGSVLATDINAPFGLPIFTNSAADGYAVASADLGSAPLTLPVSGEARAGGPYPGPLAAGTAVRIMTGAPVPAGADTVVRVELTDAGTSTVQIREAVTRGTDIRLADSDLKSGDPVAAAGSELTAVALGLLAGLGIDQVRVHRRPRVAVISTGSELTAVGQPLAPGFIYDSNSVMLSALCTAVHAEVAGRYVLHDDPAAALPVFERAADEADLVITSGGISAGAYEVVKDVLIPTGDVVFEAIAMQPGKPQGAGMFAGTPIVTLPGNPVSSFVSFQVFVVPMLRRLAGHRAPVLAGQRAVLTDAVAQHPRLRRYRRAWYDPHAGTVRLVGGISSHLLASLAAANALAVIPAGTTTLPVGTTIDVLPLPGGPAFADPAATSG